MSWHFLASTNERAAREARGNQAGFGLIELMVAITVMVLVASVVVVRHSTFNSALLLRSQAFDIALGIREVQLSAVSASGDTGDFRQVYGLYFDSSTNNNGYYIFFRDLNEDEFYTSSPNEQFGPISELDQRFEIGAIRAVGGESLSSDDVSVVFERPNFDARFFRAPGDQIDAPSIEIDVARRGMSGTECGSHYRTIEITRTGQIALLDCPE